MAKHHIKRVPDPRIHETLFSGGARLVDYFTITRRDGHPLIGCQTRDGVSACLIEDELLAAECVEFLRENGAPQFTSFELAKRARP